MKHNTKSFYIGLTFLIIILAFLVIIPNHAFAEEQVTNTDLDNPAPGFLVNVSDFKELLKNIINIILEFAGAIAVIFLMIGGFRYVTSTGSEEALEKAKKTITSAIIGIVIIVMAFAIVNIVNNLLLRTDDSGTNTGNTTDQGNNNVTIDTTNPPPAGNVGEPYTFTFTASNCPPADCEWQIQGLEGSGISQQGTSGMISSGGAAVANGGDYEIHLQALNNKSNEASSVERFTLTIIGGEQGQTSP